MPRRPRSYKDRPQLLSNADIGYSPWIGAARLEADGMLVLWQHEKSSIELAAYIGPHRSQDRDLQVAQNEVVVGYLIVPPKSSPR